MIGVAPASPLNCLPPPGALFDYSITARDRHRGGHPGRRLGGVPGRGSTGRQAREPVTAHSSHPGTTANASEHRRIRRSPRKAFGLFMLTDPG
jgi:hypothetical protein